MSGDSQAREVLTASRMNALAKQRIEGLEDERDRLAVEVERLRQGLWDCAAACGMDTDGNDGPQHTVFPDIVDLALREVRELREESDTEAKRLEAQLSDVSEEMQGWIVASRRAHKLAEDRYEQIKDLREELKASRFGGLG